MTYTCAPSVGLNLTHNCLILLVRTILCCLNAPKLLTNPTFSAVILVISVTLYNRCTYIYIYYKIAKNTWHIFTWLFLAVKLGLLVKFSVFHRLSGRCVSGAASGAKARSDPGGDSPPGSQGLEGPVPNGGKTKRRSDNNKSKIPVVPHKAVAEVSKIGNP